MTKPQLDALLADWHRLVAAVADPAVLPGLPQEEAVWRALPDPCRPFQARWALGNCGEKLLATLREIHPEIVALQAGNTIRYNREALRKLAGKGSKPV